MIKFVSDICRISSGIVHDAVGGMLQVDNGTRLAITAIIMIDIPIIHPDHERSRSYQSDKQEKRYPIRRDKQQYR